MVAFVMIATLSANHGFAQSSGKSSDKSPDKGSAVHNLGTTITGNQEQPKVLYIVPWKAAYEDVAIPYRPISGQTDSIFSHVERHEHQRHLDFLEDLRADTTE